MYIQLLYVYNKGLLCCSFLLICYYEFYYIFYYKAAENRDKQRITEDNGTFTEYREKAQKRYVSGLLKWLYYIVHEGIIYTCKACIRFHTLLFLSFDSPSMPISSTDRCPRTTPLRILTSRLFYSITQDFPLGKSYSDENFSLLEFSLLFTVPVTSNAFSFSDTKRTRGNSLILFVFFRIPVLHSPESLLFCLEHG